VAHGAGKIAAVKGDERQTEAGVMGLRHQRQGPLESRAGFGRSRQGLEGAPSPGVAAGRPRRQRHDPLPRRQGQIGSVGGGERAGELSPDAGVAGRALRRLAQQGDGVVHTAGAEKFGGAGVRLHAPF